MRPTMIPRTLVFLGAAIIAVSACNGRDSGSDTALDRDLGLVGQNSSGQVDLNDAAKGSGGSSGGSKTGSGGGSKSGSGGSAAAPDRSGAIAAGTTISFASGSRICTNTNKVGDTFTATVKEAVTGSNGVVIPAGSEARVQITSLSRRENIKDRVEMGFVVQSIRVNGRTYNLDGRVTNVQVNQQRSAGNKDAQKVVGGAVIGAVVGQILGKDTKSTVIGAATGAAAGTVVAMAAGEYEGCIPDGGNITIALNAPLNIVIAE